MNLAPLTLGVILVLMEHLTHVKMSAPFIAQMPSLALREKRAGKEKVFVGLSGGVDSSVAASVLLQKGYEVEGVFIKIWHPDFKECPWKEDRISAKRVAASLEIPFREVDLSDEYYREVIGDMKRVYASGKTPNPDILCNARIKFGAFLDWAEREGADKIATGHHARIMRDFSGEYRLLRGIDSGKDQSYFLWQVAREKLERILMPIGEMRKKDVRAHARRRNIPSADRPDSQGLCFVGDVDMHEFLRKLLSTSPGPVCIKKKVVGEHDGAALYTLGQRHKFRITDPKMSGTPLFVVSSDIASNAIEVSESIESALSQIVLISDFNWISEAPLKDRVYTAEVRYHQKPQEVKVGKCDEGGYAVHFAQPQLASSGQSLVVYDGEVCLGGGVIR